MSNETQYFSTHHRILDFDELECPDVLASSRTGVLNGRTVHFVERDAAVADLLTRLRDVAYAPGHRLRDPSLRCAAEIVDAAFYVADRVSEEGYELMLALDKMLEAARLVSPTHLLPPT